MALFLLGWFASPEACPLQGLIVIARGCWEALFVGSPSCAASEDRQPLLRAICQASALWSALHTVSPVIPSRSPPAGYSGQACFVGEQRECAEEPCSRPRRREVTEPEGSPVWSLSAAGGLLHPHTGSVPAFGNFGTCALSFPGTSPISEWNRFFGCVCVF